MSALFRAHGRRVVDALAPAGDAAHMHRAGVYLTDEVFLFRVVGVVAAQGKGMVELEWDLGYPFALVLMVLAAVLPIVYFKWRKWL